MAAKHEIEVTIDETTGEITFEAHGIHGKGCLGKLKEFVDALGEQKAAPTPTREMHEAATVQAGGRR